jgi:hypothetical protein
MFIRMQFALRTSLQCRNYQLEHGHACIFGQGGAGHGEVRNGGFPDCLLQKVRKDDLQGTDPAFMFYMQRTSLIMLSKKDSKIFRRYDDPDSRS